MPANSDAGANRSPTATLRDLCTDHEKKTSAGYNQFRRVNKTQNGLVMRLAVPDGGAIAWSFGDSAERGGWGHDQIQAIERLAPHIRQFSRVRRAMADPQALGASLAELLENRRSGFIRWKVEARQPAALQPRRAVDSVLLELVTRQVFLEALAHFELDWTWHRAVPRTWKPNGRGGGRDRGAPCVAATFEVGSSTAELEGSHLICTVPLPVIDQIEFEPTLSAASRHASVRKPVSKDRGE